MSTTQTTKKTNQRKKPNPNELFVGNLSYFCEEQNLYDLFSNALATRDIAQGQNPLLLMNYVSSVRIIYSEGQPQRSLMFGFVTLNNFNDAQYIIQQLQNAMFMGRKLRVQFSNTRDYNAGSYQSERVGFQLHVAFQSHFPENEIKRPTEEFFRDIFTPFGEELLDIAVKEYTLTEAPPRQEGYAFATFASEQIAEIVIQQYSGFSKDGITLDCTWSHRTNHLKKAEYFFQMRAASLGLAVPPSGGSPPAGSGTASLQGNSSSNSIASGIERKDSLVDLSVVESLKLPDTTLRTISPLEQISSKSLPIHPQSQASVLSESLHPSCETLNTQFDSLLEPSVVSSSHITRNSIPTANGSNYYSSLHNGAYSHSSIDTIARSNVPQSYQRSFSIESRFCSSDLNDVPTTGFYHDQRMNGIHVQYGNHLSRSQQQRYGSQSQWHPQSQNMPSMRPMNANHQAYPYPRNPYGVPTHDANYPIRSIPHSQWNQNVPATMSQHDSQHAGYYNSHSVPRPINSQMCNTAPNRQYERHMVDSAHLYSNKFMDAHYSQHATTLSDLAMRGNLCDPLLPSTAVDIPYRSGYNHDDSLAYGGMNNENSGMMTRMM